MGAEFIGGVPWEAGRSVGANWHSWYGTRGAPAARARLARLECITENVLTDERKVRMPEFGAMWGSAAGRPQVEGAWESARGEIRWRWLCRCATLTWVAWIVTPLFL